MKLVLSVASFPIVTDPVLEKVVAPAMEFGSNGKIQTVPVMINR